jgi:hypothetical protein
LLVHGRCAGFGGLRWKGVKLQTRTMKDNLLDIGVRQGENVYPFLFAIYLNDLEQFSIENNVNGLENIRNMCSETLNIFVKLFSLLYADDTIILSETEADMQYALAIFEKYCHHWKLKINLQKTKVIIFCKRK